MAGTKYASMVVSKCETQQAAEVCVLRGCAADCIFFQAERASLTH